MSLNKLSLLIAASLAFTACDGDDPAPTSEGNTQAGTNVGGTPAGGTTPGGTDVAGTTPGGTTPGGTDVAGTTPGGTTPGGTDVAGTTPGGTEVGGAEVGGAEERVGLGDTSPLACTGMYCPSARLTGLTLPTDAAAATAGGCRLAGSSNGTALGGLLALAGGAVDTNSFVQPDENGEISLILINQLKGWGEGLTGNAAGELVANFYTGVAAGEGFEIDPVSLQDDGTPYISFPGTTVTDGLLSTPSSTFTVSLPILEGVPLSVRLDQAKLQGDVSLDTKGFNLAAGVLGGYLTKDGIRELISGLIAACTSPTPPDSLSSVCGILGTDVEAALALLSGFVTFDTAVSEAGDATSCAPADCNALSVCLLVEMSSVNVTGVAAGK